MYCRRQRVSIGDRFVQFSDSVTNVQWVFATPLFTSNATAITEVRSASARLPVRGAPWCVLLHYYVAIIFCRWVWYCALSLHVFTKIKVMASSSSPTLPLCQILFLSRPPLLSYRMEKNHVLNHSHTPSSFDAHATEALALQN